LITLVFELKNEFLKHIYIYDYILFLLCRTKELCQFVLRVTTTAQRNTRARVNTGGVERLVKCTQISVVNTSVWLARANFVVSFDLQGLTVYMTKLNSAPTATQMIKNKNGNTCKILKLYHFGTKKVLLQNKNKTIESLFYIITKCHTAEKVWESSVNRRKKVSLHDYLHSPVAS